MARKKPILYLEISKSFSIYEHLQVQQNTTNKAKTLPGRGGGQNIDFFTDMVNLVVMVGIDTNFLVVLVLIVNKYAMNVWYKWYKQQCTKDHI